MSIKIGVIGAESTGKSTLCKQLAERLGGVCIEEYARTYVENLDREYTYEDVEHIARRQIQELTANYDADYVFFDTELIITKVWFEDKYGRTPKWFEDALNEIRLDNYLLLLPDLDFEPDSVRENGNRRGFLTDCYIAEMKRLGIEYKEVSGMGDQRILNALRILGLS